MDFKKQFPTQGDLAREQLRRRGIPYFADVRVKVNQQLSQLSDICRAAFALACAERLMRRHEQLPVEKQSAFTLGWRPLLDVMWLGLEGQQPEASHKVQKALEEFYASPFDHRKGQDALPGADEDAAAGSIYASKCFLKCDVQAAYWAAFRAVDAAFHIAVLELDLDWNAFEWDPSATPMPLAKEAMPQRSRKNCTGRSWTWNYSSEKACPERFSQS